MKCGCGCGKEVKFRECFNWPSFIKKCGPIRYLPGHNSIARRGERHQSWAGGRTRHSDGYIYVYAPNHPNAGKERYILEHRLVMEKHIGRYLRKDELIHHINGNKSDNRIENLEIKTWGEHTTLENLKRRDQISKIASREEHKVLLRRLNLDRWKRYRETHPLKP